jgi:hypothetical protein
MIEGEVNPHKGDRDTLLVIDYVLGPDVIGDARVKVYLNAYDPIDNGFDYCIDETLIDYFNVNPDNVAPINIKLSGIVSGFYRVCLKLAYDGSYYQDCDKENQFLLIDDTPITQTIEEAPKPDIELTVISPDKVLVNQEFMINISVSNKGSALFDGVVYSYVHNGSEKLSQGAWDGNSEELSLSPGACTQVILLNKILKKGNFTITVRVKHDETIDVKKNIEAVLEDDNCLFLNSPLVIDDELRVTVSNICGDEALVNLVVYSQEESFNNSFTVLPKRSYEAFINASLIKGRAFILLYKDLTLVDEKNIVIDSFSNESPIMINNGTPLGKLQYQDNGTPFITGWFISSNYLSEEPLDSMEILLYPIIIVLSLTSLVILIWKL